MSDKLKRTAGGVAALAAIALGGAAIANAGSSPAPADSSGTNAAVVVTGPGADNPPGNAGNKNDSDAPLTGTEKDQAIASALKITGGGKANSTERDDQYNATFEVEVTKPDGNTVDVRLDDNYNLVVVEDDHQG